MGQTVALVDSGADSTLPQLSARVSAGMDVVDGSGGGDTDCLGSGTAMAGIIAAQPVAGSPLVGVAPDSTVMPVRVATREPSARASDVATAVRMAVSHGATVLVVGTCADTTDPTVATALSDAVQQGVVVVAPALPASARVDPRTARLTDGVLRVGGVGVDSQVMERYQAGGVDLVAPGRDVAALGITGVGMLAVTGGQYAAAFVAATAALVRAAYPELSASQVVQRLEATTDRMPDTAPSGRFGYGLVNPRSAVEKVLADESSAPDSATVAAGQRRGRQLPALLVIIALAVVVTALLAVRVRGLVVTRDGGTPAGGSGTGDSQLAGPADTSLDDPRSEPVGREPTGAGAGSEWSREASTVGLGPRGGR